MNVEEKIFLLMSHLICVDQQIHNSEEEMLQAYAKEMNLSDNIINEKQKIISLSDDCIQIKEIIYRFPKESRDECIKFLFIMSSVDNYMDEKEIEMITMISKYWDIDNLKINQIKKEAKEFCDKEYKEKTKSSIELSRDAQFLIKLEKIFSPKFVQTASAFLSYKMKEKLKTLKDEILLSGPEYDEAVKNCEIVASSDFEFLINLVEHIDIELKGLATKLQRNVANLKKETTKGKSDNAKTLVELFEKHHKQINEDVLDKLDNLLISSTKKKRVLTYFTISFVGMTKAGKSTLHSIITKSDGKEIGVGKQRTTRLNRIYEWKNIRIIDTPGIGAPGGKSDEEIAKGIVDESDLIVFVLTNNNQKETEFRFLKILKEKAKALIILLNVKENLDNEVRLKRFMKNPEKEFSDDPRKLGGHIKHIRRYANEYYGNDNFEIIPVQLLAAKKAVQKEIEDHEKLYQHSRIHNFLNSLQYEVINNGTLRRSQTFLGCTVKDFQDIVGVLNDQKTNYNQSMKFINEKWVEAKKKIDNSKKLIIEQLLIKINEVYFDVQNSIPYFTDKYWNLKKSDIEFQWKVHLKTIKMDERIKDLVKQAQSDFVESINELLEEIGKEIELLSAMFENDFEIDNDKSSTLWKNIFRWGGVLSGVAGSIALIFSGPIGWTLIGLGVAFQFVSGFFKSKAKQKAEKIDKISTVLNKQIEDTKINSINIIEDELPKLFNSIQNDIERYFELMIANLDKTIEVLNKALIAVEESKDELNYAYAKRIIDWLNNEIGELTDENIANTIASVKRNIGIDMEITLNKGVGSKKQNGLDKILQEKLMINEQRRLS